MPVAAQESALPWSSFQNGGRSSVDANLPTQWSYEDGIAWQVETHGYGQSSPVIDNSQVVITSTSGDNKERFHVAAYDLRSGIQNWQRDFRNPTPEENTSFVSRAAPTAAVDLSAIYAFFEGGTVASLTHAGELNWERNLVEDYGPIKARHGLAASVEQNDKHVFIWVERSDDPYILALDKVTGQTVWKVDGVGATSWSSPRLISVDQVQHLVCSSSGKILGVDPDTGEHLWELSDIANSSSCTPVPVCNGRFFIGASEGRGDAAERTAAWSGVVQIERAETGNWNARAVWQNKKATSSFGSPVVVGDAAFLVNRVGVLAELNLDTGAAVSPKRLKSGGVWATPVAAGGRLYVFGRNGTTSVVDLSSSKEIETNHLWEQTKDRSEKPSSAGESALYAAAVAPPLLILRSGSMLIAIGPKNVATHR